MNLSLLACVPVLIVCMYVLLVQDGDKLCEHPRAPAIFLNGVFVIGTLHMLSAVVMPGVSEVHVFFSCVAFSAVLSHILFVVAVDLSPVYCWWFTGGRHSSSRSVLPQS